MTEQRLPAVRDNSEARRWRVIRDLATFQLKLFVDGIKDLVLAPLSFFAGVYGTLRHKDDPGRHLYRVLQLGRSFDDWVDLYGAVDESGRPAVTPEARGLSEYLDQVERRLIAAQQQGALTAKTKLAIDRALDGIQQITGTKDQDPPKDET